MTGEEQIKGRVSRDDGVPTVPRPGDYYACREKDDDIEAGDLVLVTKVVGDQISYVSGEEDHRWDVGSFLGQYEFDPRGAEKREAEILGLMRDVRETLREAAEIREQEEGGVGLAIGQPQLGDGADQTVAATDERGAESSETAIVPMREQAALAVEQTKLRAAETRNRVELFLASVEKKKERIRALRKEQEAALEAMGGLRKLVKRAEQIIKILNVYLGHDEEIVQIREGEAAPADTKISVRQLVLYADEECAINARHGGLDFEDIGKFDKWVAEPDNLRQVLPEARGIVAFKPRRKNKDYGNTAANVYLNMLNKQTYFLIRNGDRLYRIASGVSVGSLLFPTRTEFDELFIKKEYDYKKRRNVRTRLRPGSRDFAKALDEADEKQREYGMVLLMIQGLIDRTDVFNPFLADYVNVMDRRRHEDFIAYIHDGENLLGTGRPDFSDWQRELNELLDVGHRVIGVFDMYDRGLSYDRYGNCERLHPPRAERPESKVLHTIERRDGDYFTFFYQRKEEIYTPDWRERENYRRPKIRASCRVKPGDSFLINFDAVTVADIEFYLTDRVNRHEYLVMFPLLKKVVELKEAEGREEEPFRKLLVGQIMRAHEAAQEDAEAVVDELIKWWKFKNHTHRALKSEDAKAVRMIVQEFGLRREREAERRAQQALSRIVVEAVRAAEPGAIYVGHKRENSYVALVPENEENIFVREQEWKLDAASSTATMKGEKRWRVVDSRRLRWAELWTGDRWQSWQLDVRASRFLTDPEREELAGMVWDDVRGREARWKAHQDDKRGVVFWPLALCLTPRQSLHTWYADRRAVCPEAKSDKGIKEPGLERIAFTWKRDTRGRVKLGDATGSGHYSYKISNMGSDKRLPKDGERPWDAERGRKKNELPATGEVHYRVLWTDPAAIERYDAEWRRAMKAEAVRDERQKIIWRAAEQVEEAMKAKIIAAIRERYERDHGAPALWEKHLESQCVRDQHAEGFRKALDKIVSRGLQVSGRTVGELVEAAAGLGIEIEAEEFAALPLEHVVKVRAKRKGKKGN